MSGKILERSPEDGPSVPSRPSRVCVCLNCGESFEQGRKAAEFCSRKCVRAWNNRRYIRGAELYDLMMIQRFDRGEATKHKVWTALTRLTRQYRDEDIRERGGRRSWRRLRSIIDNKIVLWTQVFRR